MMEVEVAEMGCPDLETLAAFVDGRLAPANRRSVMAHLADCEACYEMVTETLHTEEELVEEAEPAPAPVVPLQRPAWRRRSRWVGAAVAAALLAALIPTLFRSPALPRIPDSLPEGWTTPADAYRGVGGPGGSGAPMEWADLRLGALLADLELARQAGDVTVAKERAGALAAALGEEELETWTATVQRLGEKLEDSDLTPETRDQISSLKQDMLAEFSIGLQLGRWAQLGRFAALTGDAGFLKGRLWRRQLADFERADLPETMRSHLYDVRSVLEEGTEVDLVQALTALLTSDGGDL